MPVTALTDAPAAAQFKWRADCTWKKGTHSHSTVKSFFGLGEEQKHKTTFSFDADHPEVFASEDYGATPVEFVLVALASCLTAGIAAVAQHRGIQLRSVSATIEGAWTCRASSASTATSATASAASRSPTTSMPTPRKDEIKALVAQSQKRSAVYDIVTNPTNVTVEIK